MTKRKGFTLAEVLITLTIIGVIAALTIPNLIQNHEKKQTITKLQKAISVWNNVYSMSLRELGEPSDAEVIASSAEDLYNKYYAPYLKGKTCKTYQKCKYLSSTPFTYISRKTWGFMIVVDPANIGIITDDGMFYVYQAKGGGDRANLLEDQGLLVDINGSKKPNRLGRDIFFFKPNKNNGFWPECSTSNYEEIQDNCSKNKAGGQCCAEKIRRDGWQIKDDYPWD